MIAKRHSDMKSKTITKGMFNRVNRRLLYLCAVDADTVEAYVGRSFGDFFAAFEEAFDASADKSKWHDDRWSCELDGGLWDEMARDIERCEEAMGARHFAVDAKFSPARMGGLS